MLIRVWKADTVQFIAIDKIAVVSITVAPRVYHYNWLFLVDFPGVKKESLFAKL